VESPAKAKTIKKYLWKDFDVTASVGHIEDLPEKSLWVDIDNNFQAEYEIMKWKKKVITDLKKMVKNHEKVYLATDEDREGEAIAWHLTRVLGLPADTPRITFHEITKTAIQKAIKNPRTIDMNLVSAQQWRRILDRLVWYKVSPVLWQKIKRWLSAWRVQSVAVKLIVERENEIKNFKPTETWELKADLTKEDIKLNVKLEELKGKKVDFKSEKKVLEFLKSIWVNTENSQVEEKDFTISPYLTKKVKNYEFLDNIDFVLQETKKSKSKRKPSAPFITSTLQQEASNKLGWWVKQVMQVAQKLYENGYITYMRTDDVTLSPEAIKQAETYIKSEFWPEYSHPTQYKWKNKNAQEAHEAIRPTNLTKQAQDLGLTGQEASLYNLIWKRTIASQMAPAEIAITTYKFTTNHDDLWNVKWEVVVFDWFLKVYWGGKESLLPALKKWEKLISEKIYANQKYSKAPARYTESSLVKEMEKLGIWRPSTYAAVISTIIARWYVEKTDDKKLKPTDIAFLVTEFLEKNFEDLMDYKFTAKMEDELDKIALWKLEYTKMLSKFWNKFKKYIEATWSMEKVQQKTGKKCPKCGSDLVYKFWKFGKFIACSNYPNCKYVEQTEDEKSYEEELNKKFAGKDCPAGGKIVVKKSKNGYFLASDKYPEVKWTMAPDLFELNQQYGGEKCDKCWEWEMVVRKWKKWYFLACNKYPKCKNIKPLNLNKKEE